MGWPRQAKYGYIATYFPLVRLEGFVFRRHERFISLDLEMHASYGGETLQILFPAERESEVLHVAESALRQRSDASSDPVSPRND
jgi:hypothetical protein